MTDQRNLLLAIVLSVAILLSFQLLVEKPAIEQEQAAQQRTEEIARPGGPPTAGTRSAPSGVGAPVAGQPPLSVAPTREAVIGTTQRVAITGSHIHGSLSLRGARIDDLLLSDYRETLEPDSGEITLLSPPNTPKAYLAQFGWVATETGVKVPGSSTNWTANRAKLTSGSPVTLTWDNGEGLVFSQVIAVDENYMFTITQRVRNSSAKSVALHPFGLISRSSTPDVLGFFILHEGLLGVFDEKLKEVDYDDLQDEERGEIDAACSADPRFARLPASTHRREVGTLEKCSTGGWIGITDKYWLTALIPDQKAPIGSRFKHWLQNKEDRYQVDFLAAALTIPAGGHAETTSRLFAGAKVVRLLDDYRDELGISRFDLAVDWGWLWFLTKPIFKALLYFNDFIGNFGLAILLLTVLIKIAFFPLANKSYKAMSRVKKLQPKMTEIRDRYKDDRQRQQQELMGLYKKENANPAAGCLPILIQIPVFFALYKVLFVTIEMRHAPFFGWIKDLSEKDPLGILTAFGLVQWDVPAILEIGNIGIWPIIMGGTMYLQQKLNPQPADPTQAKIFMLLPIVFTFVLGRFPAGLVIYWAWNNLLSITQQYIIMRRMGVGIGGKTIGPAAAAKPPKPSKPKGTAGPADAGASADAGANASTSTGQKRRAAGTTGGPGRQRQSSRRKRSRKRAS